MRLLSLLIPLGFVIACRPADRVGELPPAPAGLHDRLTASLAAARPFERHVWRDVTPLSQDGTLTGVVEISRGDSTKWEFRIPLNRMEVDRMVPAELGGYPTNYGFIPRTISYDGDPADVLVLGPPIASGETVRGRILALMEMIDDGDLDSKVVIAPVDDPGGAGQTLESTVRDRLERFFDNYKRQDGKLTKVTGWGDEADARAYLKRTSAFFGSAASR